MTERSARTAVEESGDELTQHTHGRMSERVDAGMQQVQATAIAPPPYGTLREPSQAKLPVRDHPLLPPANANCCQIAPLSDGI